MAFAVVGWGALVRLLPRVFWRRPRYPRPPAAHALHVVAGLEPDRFYRHDDLLVEDLVRMDDRSHGQVIRDFATVDVVVTPNVVNVIVIASVSVARTLLPG